MATYPPDILRELKQLRNRLQNLETTPQPPSIRLSGLGSATFDLFANSQITFTATLTDSDGGRVLGQPSVTLYKGSPISSAKAFPSGSDWSDAERMAIRFSTWIDYGESDNNNLVMKIFIVNPTGTDYLDLYLAINVRFMTRGGSL